MANLESSKELLEARAHLAAVLSYADRTDQTLLAVLLSEAYDVLNKVAGQGDRELP